MRNKENRICDFIDFVVAPIEFDKQRKNLATIRNIHTHTQQQQQLRKKRMSVRTNLSSNLLLVKPSAATIEYCN